MTDGKYDYLQICVHSLVRLEVTDMQLEIADKCHIFKLKSLTHFQVESTDIRRREKGRVHFLLYLCDGV